MLGFTKIILFLIALQCSSTTLAALLSVSVTGTVFDLDGELNGSGFFSIGDNFNYRLFVNGAQGQDIENDTFRGGFLASNNLVQNFTFTVGSYSASGSTGGIFISDEKENPFFATQDSLRFIHADNASPTISYPANERNDFTLSSGAIGELALTAFAITFTTSNAGFFDTSDLNLTTLSAWSEQSSINRFASLYFETDGLLTRKQVRIMIEDVRVSAVPLPGSFALFALSNSGFLGFRERQNQKASAF